MTTRADWLAALKPGDKAYVLTSSPLGTSPPTVLTLVGATPKQLVFEGRNGQELRYRKEDGRGVGRRSPKPSCG